MTRLRAGFAKAEMTPPVGLDLTGFIARENPSAGVRDPLFIHSLVLETNGDRLLLVGLDCTGFEADIRDTLWKSLEEATGIPSHQISLWSSHTHSAPALIQLHGCGEVSPDYIRNGFIPAAVESAEAALKNLAPAEVTYSEADAGIHHMYRRSTETDARDDHLIDDIARAFWFTSEEGEPLGVLWFWTAHPSNFCDKYFSADYVGRVARRFHEDFGGISVFGQGCAGDVNSNRTEDRLETVCRVGDGVANLLLESRKSARPFDIERVESKLARITLPYLPAPTRAWYLEYEEEQRAIEESLEPGIEKRVAGAMSKWAGRWARSKPPKTRDALLQAIRIGEQKLVMLPFEVLTGVGHAIRERCDKNTLVVAYANGCFSYLARAAQYPVGGYEVDSAYRFFGLPSYYTPEAAEIVIDAAVDLIGTLD